MPSLTLQTAGTTRAQSGSEERGEPSSPSPPEPEPEPERERGGRRQVGDRSGRAERGSGASAPGGRGDRSRRGTAPPEGRDASTLYPELTLKTLAPRVDATGREEQRRDVTRRSGERDRTSRSRGQGRGREQGIDDLLTGGIDAGPSSSEVDRLVEQLHREIERKMRIERERRGL